MLSLLNLIEIIISGISLSATNSCPSFHTINKKDMGCFKDSFIYLRIAVFVRLLQFAGHCLIQKSYRLKVFIFTFSMVAHSTVVGLWGLQHPTLLEQCRKSLYAGFSIPTWVEMFFIIGFISNCSIVGRLVRPSFL